MTKYLFTLTLALGFHPAEAQSLTDGTLKGTITDSSGAPVPSATIDLANPFTLFSLHTQSDMDGAFLIAHIPPNRYSLRISFSGFRTFHSEVDIRTSVPLTLNVKLELAGQETSITVQEKGAAMLEAKTVTSDVVDRQLVAELPALSPDSGLNDAIIYTTPGVAADSNGFFHPLGDHAQVSYVLDGQPISDQRNKVFSTSIPANAIQSMEVVSGSPPAEFGDKTSLVVNASTRSGLGQKPSGSFAASYGSFGTVGEEATLGLGTSRWGNFLTVNSQRSGRFLDTPEFRPVHDIGNTGTIFDHIDVQPAAKDAFHLNLSAARNWFQVPNTYSQPLQDQRQKVVSFNIAPGYQHTIGGQSLLSINAFARRDEVNYYPSGDPLYDSPATLSQHRTLANWGGHADFSHTGRRHTWKTGINATQTRLDEQFALGITDPLYNAPCDERNTQTPVAGFSETNECRAAGFIPNPGFLSGLIAYDLSRGGQLYRFAGKANINQLAAFGQDSISLGNLTLSLGLRFDVYRGLTSGGGLQPRGAFSYLFRLTGTVVRGGYSHTIETPTNENLVASSATGAGGLASNLFSGTVRQQAIALGSRNQYDAGLQQSLGKWALLDVGYFRKYTRNAFDFDALFSTPITFPIGWRQSKLDGVSARIGSTDLHGIRVYMTMGHADARFFGPENGGIIFNSNLSLGAYRQDHDQVYQQNVNVHYQPGKSAWWSDFTWRYDSGLVVGAVNNLADALALTADQQAVIGLYCGADIASFNHRITSCNSTQYGAERIHILAPGAENDDRNPPRTKSRHIFSLGAGTDNLFHTEHVRTTLRFTVINLSNEAALYNFLSPFSGTHWVQPRTYEARIGWAF